MGVVFTQCHGRLCSVHQRHMLYSHGSINTAFGALQAQREYPPSLEDVKDKFLVQSTIAPPDTREVGADTFDPATNKSIRQTKLRVLLVSTCEIETVFWKRLWPLDCHEPNSSLATDVSVWLLCCLGP